MKFTQIFLLILILVVFTSCTTEKNWNDYYRLPSNCFLYWQKDSIISFNDFEKSLDSNSLQQFDFFKVNSLPNITIHSVLDVPKKRRNLKHLKEKYYIAPAFNKCYSPIKDFDSLDLKVANLFFSIAEYHARKARKAFNEIEKNAINQIKIEEGKELAKYKGNELKLHGIIIPYFSDIIKAMNYEMKTMFVKFTREYMDSDREKTYYNWKMKIDNLLQDLNEYQTKEIDKKRFILGTPLSDDYKLLIIRLLENY